MSNCFMMSYPCHSHQLSVQLTEYTNGRLAVELLEEPGKEHFATVSVNVEEAALSEGEFVFKTYSENHGLYEAMLTGGIVEPTGRFVDLGFAGSQPICRLVKH